MPGWVKKGGSASQAPQVPDLFPPLSEDASDATPATQRRPIEEVPTESAAPSPGRRAMSEQQRDALLAEVLGDVGQLAQMVQRLSVQLDAVNQSLTANDLVRWRNALDLKMEELAKVNLSDHAAERMQGVAAAWVQRLGEETNTLVKLQVKKTVNDVFAFNQLLDRLNKEWLMRLGWVAGAGFVGTLLAHMVWALF